MPGPVPDEKRALREGLLATRADLDPALRLTASRDIARRLVTLPRFAAARTVALYAALGAEVDTGAIAGMAAAAGKRLAWPVLEPGTRVLRFATCAFEALQPGSLGAPEPPSGAAPVALEELDCAVLPVVAFDRLCRRLGRGGGHYDATLAALPPTVFRVGLAFAIQAVDPLPIEPHDAPLDAVVTEREVLTAPHGRAPMPPV